MFDKLIAATVNNAMGLVIVLGLAAASGLLAWAIYGLWVRLAGPRIAGGQVNWVALRRPWILTFAAVGVYLSLAYTSAYFSAGTLSILHHALAVIAIVGLGWLVIGLTDALGVAAASYFDISKDDNRKERAMLTKFHVLRRVWIGLVCVLTIGAVLFTFPPIRALGAGILASAGVAGIVLGIALRPTVETFIASIQVALTEPINIDDVVIVEGEWGRIEEIRPTYVVVRIWDDRRLIVPLTYFISQPFQNWTRTRADITGVVTLQLDFTTPIDAVRKKAGEFVTQSEKFDGRFWNVQITESQDKAMTLRVLCTASNASNAWDLRCEVREKLITYLQQAHPGSLPRLRAQVGGSDSAADENDRADRPASE